MRDTFTLPETPPVLESLIGSNTKVVVVSIIGKSAYNTFGQKVKPLHKVFNFNNNSKEDVTIEGSYDDDNQIIYLHLFSLLDTNNFVEHYESLLARCDESYNNNDFLTVYNEVKSSYARALMFLFHVSHIVILSDPGYSFDINYVQIFKSLDNIRQKCMNEITQTLSSIPKLNTEWVSNGRPCTPRLVFYFERCPKQFKDSQKYPKLNIKKFEHEMEDRIYHILRKVRIVGNTNCNSLFAIPANQEYVYVNNSKETNNDRLESAVNNFMKCCQSGQPELLAFPFSCQAEENKKGRTFYNFLRVHIDLAFSKGFDDNIGTARHGPHASAYFEVPIIDQWFKVAKTLHNYFIPNAPISENHLRDEVLSSLCTDTKFSEQRCQKVLPLALARYQENLPAHYTTSHHQTRLAMALGVFTMQARGSLFNKYSQQLTEKCNKHFEAGHQLCEHPSLTGNPCTKPRHEPNTEHCSGVRYVAVCDCGRKQGSRDDPYSLKQANYVFYQNLSNECVCETLNRVRFSVFQPSTDEFRAASVNTPELPIASQTISVHESHEVASDLSQTSGLLDESPPPLVLDAVHHDNDPEDKGSIRRQPSTTEYLPGMLTTSSPVGLLPQFPSWALVCLGASSLYSHNLGLSEAYHPGFLTSTNFLLPWDVTVRLEHGWPIVTGSLRPRRSRIPASTSAQFVVKIFVGVEYECPRGHRFMLSSPEKVLRANSGIVKDTGHKVTSSDMPLYYNCPCRSPGGSKPLVAQLMRIHVVTPKAPVFVTLNPKIQPGAGAPFFVPTLDGPVRLTQSAYWVLRLPYVYGSEQECYVPSRHHCDSAARLVAGMWGVAQINQNGGSGIVVGASTVSPQQSQQPSQTHGT